MVRKLQENEIHKIYVGTVARGPSSHDSPQTTSST
jgi:hypothetical protein